jgi:phenylpropionate dioxygenase-like ring-hydroxylating dioxygenase large terminal subunit
MPNTKAVKAATANGESKYSGYYQRPSKGPDAFLTQVGRGTPGGEYLRRFWMPVAYAEELKDVPLRVRALGEDLVVFRDRSGQVGVLTLNCCHRNTSLEFGVIEEKGLRCCYHGRLFDVDGTILEMPGESESSHLRTKVRQGAYPTHVFGGIVFTYMGPPDRIPVFPVYDRLKVPGVKLIPGLRFQWPCNWLQVQENTLDPLHTVILHTIPQRRGMDHFAGDFGNLSEFIWADTPGGQVYLAARHVGDNVWVRSTDSLGAHCRSISTVFEGGTVRKRASAPFFTGWILPIDDDECCHFYVSQVVDDEPMTFPERRILEEYGMTSGRPYHDRQLIPGDYDAQVSQGRINDQSRETLGTSDRGVVMFRSYLRRNIEAVARGEDPHGFYLTQEDVPPTFANDCIVDAATIGGDPDDPKVLRAFCEQLLEEYRKSPPMTAFR